MVGAETILSRLCDLQGTNFEIIDCQVRDTEVVWWIAHKQAAEYECPRCGAKLEACHDKKWIKLQDHPLGFRRSVWMVHRARILCSCSMSVRVEKLPFRSKHHRLTQRFVDLIEHTLCTKMFTVADVARIFKLDYSVVYKIDHDVLLRLVQHTVIGDPINISVDEKSFLKGQSYVTVVTDTDLGKVIWVSKGNTQESLDEFFQVLGPERCQKIKTVAKDLHKPYAASCKEHIPHALEVADSFHVVQRLNKALDDCRKELSVGSVLAVSKRKIISGLQWVLRYKLENLPQKHLASLDQLAKVNEPLYRAYLHKECFYEFFEFKPSQVDDAEKFLIGWIVDAFKIKLQGLTEFAEYIKRNTNILLNIIRTGRSSAISEGINRKISVIKAMAYGYRNINYFMLKILQRCGVLGINWTPAQN